MTDNISPTETPWEVSSSTILVSSDGQIIANMLDLGLMSLGLSVDIEQSTANANHIVECVNNAERLAEEHAEMLELLKDTVACARVKGMTMEMLRIRVDVQNLIKKIEGGKQ